MVVEMIKLIQISLGKMYLLMKSKEGYNDKRTRGGDAAHYIILVIQIGEPIHPWGIFSTYYQYHFSKGDSKEESRRIYSVAPDLTEFK